MIWIESNYFILDGKHNWCDYGPLRLHTQGVKTPIRFHSITLSFSCKLRLVASIVCCKVVSQYTAVTHLINEFSGHSPFEVVVNIGAECPIWYVH